MFGIRPDPEIIDLPAPATQRELNWDVTVSQIPDEAKFFSYHFEQLHKDTLSACRKFFGIVNFHGRQSPWAYTFPNEFYKYVQSVAHPDVLMGNWDGILRNREERETLACGIVMTILDEHVFSSLLFGAEPGHLKSLSEKDWALLDVEGFTRTRIRSRMNKEYLRTTGGEPFLFWKEVDRVATELVVLLVPLYKFVGSKRGDGMPSMSELYQAFHDIVAYAGYIGVLTRGSSSIYVYDRLKPGDKWNISDEIACYASFNMSSDLADERDLRLGVRVTPWDRISRCKISMLPRITRHKYLVDANGPGVGTYRVQSSRGVFYKGWRDMKRAEDDFVSLKDHVEHAQKKPKTVLPVVALSMLGFVLSMALYLIWVRWCPFAKPFWALLGLWQVARCLNCASG